MSYQPPLPTRGIFAPRSSMDQMTPEQMKYYDQKLNNDRWVLTHVKPEPPPPEVHYYIKTKYVDFFNPIPSYTVKPMLEAEFNHDIPPATDYDPIPGTNAKGFGWNLDRGLVVGVHSDNYKLIEMHNARVRFNGGAKNKKKYGCGTKRRRHHRKASRRRN